MTTKASDALAQRLAHLEDEGKNDIFQRRTHNLNISDAITNCGFAYIELHNDGNAEFRVELGGNNANKLLDFLLNLTEEQPERDLTLTTSNTSGTP